MPDCFDRLSIYKFDYIESSTNFTYEKWTLTGTIWRQFCKYLVTARNLFGFCRQFDDKSARLGFYRQTIRYRIRISYKSILFPSLFCYLVLLADHSLHFFQQFVNSIVFV